MVTKIVIANQKGGVGKTTTTVALGHGLALKDRRVLVMDLDTQGQCSSLLGLEREQCLFNLLVNDPPLRDVVRTTGRPNLYLLPGGKRTRSAEILMAAEGGYRPDILKQLLDNPTLNNGTLHYLVLDTAPSVSGLQENALFAADVLLIPASVDHLALEGVAAILKTLRSVDRPIPPVVRVIPTFYDERTNESQANLERLRKRFGERTTAPIHRATILRECAAVGQTIFELAPNTRAAEEYAELVWEVLHVAE